MDFIVKENVLHGKINTAIKWSSITELLVKIISPITNMVLARLLAPEAFGVVATVTMIVSFVEMFTDAGFQKYLIQREFNNEKEKFQNANVAFWTNFALSIFLWGIIILFNDKIATLVGNPGLGFVIILASVQLPITAFSSIQMALYKRDFDYKTLFLVRVISATIPFIVSIPLAMLGFSYWGVIIGNICMQLSNAIIMTLKSKWKPKLFYSFRLLKKMFSFSFWTLLESISIWLTIWVDTFIIGSYLNQHYVGVFKTSTSMVNTLMNLIVASIIPILFSALSRLQNDEEQFNRLFYNAQRILSMLIFPLGVGVYLYSDLATNLLLGSKWKEASEVIGLWSLSSALMIVFGNVSSEVYRAKGRPRLSFVAQLLHLIVLIPTLIMSVKYGFKQFIYFRNLIRLQLVFVHLFMMGLFIRISVLRMFKNMIPVIISVGVMFIAGYTLQKINDSIFWDFISIILCATLYFILLFVFPETRKIIKSILNRTFKMKKTNNKLRMGLSKK